MSCNAADKENTESLALVLVLVRNHRLRVLLVFTDKTVGRMGKRRRA